MKGSNLTAIICIALGASLYITGTLFRIMHWPGAFLSIYAGQILVAIGVIIFLIGKFRKS